MKEIKVEVDQTINTAMLTPLSGKISGIATNVIGIRDTKFN